MSVDRSTPSVTDPSLVSVGEPPACEPGPRATRVWAYTAMVDGYPPYVNLTLSPDGGALLTARGEMKPPTPSFEYPMVGDVVAVQIPRERLAELLALLRQWECAP